MITNDLLKRIDEGMKVFDSQNTEIGKVEFIQYGSEDFDRPGPESVTTGGNTATDTAIEDSPFAEQIVDSLTNDDNVPEEVRQMLIRTGFLKIERGFLKKDAFVTLDKVTNVTEDGIHINLTKDNVPTF